MSKKRKQSRSRLLNNLSLEEKLRVVKAYSEQPSYQQLANTFKCSSKQIRNILFENNHLSTGHDSVQTQKKENEELHQRNLKNIALIDRVMKEWYYRVKLYPTTGQITYKTIREKVQEAREALNIANFIPTNSWMGNFRNDCDKFVANRELHETMLLPLNMKAIAKYVLQQQNVTKEQLNLFYEIGDSNDDRVLINPPSPLSRSPITVLSASSKNIKIDPGESDKLPVQVDPNKNEMRACKTEKLRKDCKPMMVLKSSEDALRYLRALEDFALLSENYRAIGLITQLEAHFCKTSGKKDS